MSSNDMPGIVGGVCVKIVGRFLGFQGAWTHSLSHCSFEGNANLAKPGEMIAIRSPEHPDARPFPHAPSCLSHRPANLPGNPTEQPIAQLDYDDPENQGRERNGGRSNRPPLKDPAKENQPRRP